MGTLTRQTLSSVTSAAFSRLFVLALFRIISTTDRVKTVYGRAARAFGLSFFYIVGEADRELQGALERMDPGRPVLKEAGLADVAVVLSACRLYVGNDSGITHLAAATGIPVIAPSDEELAAHRANRAQH